MAGQIGAVHTFTVMHRVFGGSAGRPPYAVAWIDLPDGTRAFGEVTGEPRIGMPVEEVDEGIWRPVD